MALIKVCQTLLAMIVLMKGVHFSFLLTKGGVKTNECKGKVEVQPIGAQKPSILEQGT